MLGGKNPVIESVKLVGGGEELSHPLIIIDKKSKTPDSYPRPFAKISKSPL
jgi:hypothetical protein